MSLFVSGFLVISLVDYRLRLSALGVIGTSGREKQIDSSVPSKGRQAKWAKQPATDQIPGRSAGSVALHPQNLIKANWTKDSKTLVLACFWVLFARAKSTPGFGAGEAP